MKEAALAAGILVEQPESFKAEADRARLAAVLPFAIMLPAMMSALGTGKVSPQLLLLIAAAHALLAAERDGATGGALALVALPVAQYPEITPPTIQVACAYPGANAQTVADTIAAPIEQQVNGVENMMYMSSQCTNDGNYTLTVTFKPGVDLNMAQVLVQNRESLA